MCQSLTQTVPASSWSATSRARWLSVLQTPADSPYSVSLAIRMLDRRAYPLLLSTPPA
jgi:hypothetical protein